MPSLLLNLECGQLWFLTHIFHLPIFAPSILLLKMSGLVSVASEIASRKLYFLGRLITEPNMVPAVRNLFDSRTESYFDANVTHVGVMLSISEMLVKYNLFHYFESWCNNSTFSSYQNCKKIVRDKILPWISLAEEEP